MKGSRGEANFVMSCKECKREFSISLIEDSVKEISCEKDYTCEPFAMFDCRGCEPQSWDSKGQLSAEAVESGTVFHEIDLSDLWNDYDEITQNNVIIESVTATFERSKD